MTRIIFNNNNAVIFKNESNIFRLYDGFGINSEDMDEIRANAKSIMIIVKMKNGTEKVYISSVENWMRNCIPYDNKGEPQTILRLSLFEKVLGE